MKKENEGISSIITAMFKSFYIIMKIHKTSLHFLTSFQCLFHVFTGEGNTRFPPFHTNQNEFTNLHFCHYKHFVGRPFQRKYCYIISPTDIAKSISSLMDRSVLAIRIRPCLNKATGRRAGALVPLPPQPIVGVQWPIRRGKL